MSIKINNLTIKYDDKTILNNFNLTINEKEHIAILGASGIGKTSFINAVMGLIDYEGEISLPKGTKICAVFQEDRLFEGLSVYRNIKMTSDLSSEAICDYIYKAGLNPHSKIYTLSGGMKRRTAILRAILADFDLLILDEPFKGLDSDTKETIIGLIMEKASEKNVILITHNPSEASCLSSRIIDFSSFSYMK